MKFAHPEILLFLWSLPLLALVFWRGRRRRHEIMSAFAALKTRPLIMPHAHHRRRLVKTILLMITLLCLIPAMAGPQYGYKWQKIERKGIDIMIALDCSKSMLAADINPTRMDRAKREIIDLLSLLKGDRAGLVAFAGTAFIQCPLTLDYNAFNLFLKALSPDFMPVGGTDLPGAVETAVNGFDTETRTEKALILITDGENTGGDPLKAAEAAAKAGIKLFCIGVGKPEGIPVPDEAGGFKKDADGQIILTRIDEDLLKKMAVLTGGTYVRSVAGDMDLDVIYTRDIRGKMKASTLSGGRKKVWEDRFQWCLGAALICLMLEMFWPLACRVLPLVLLPVIITTTAVQARADSAGEHLQQGLEAYENGNYETALNAFIKTQLDDPERPEIYYNLGNTYYKLGKYDEAVNHFKKALTDDNLNLKQKTLFNLGNAEYKAGKHEKAIQQYEAALKLNPDDENARKNIEFVKHIMDQQQKQPSGPQNKPSGDQQKDAGKQKKTSQQKSSQQDPPDAEHQQQEDSQEQAPADADRKDKRQTRDTPQPESSARQNQNSHPTKDKTTSAPAPLQSESRESQSTSSEASSADNDKQQNASKQQAARMLNRLKDKPGRAMVPVYRKRVVEKDW